jgi:hypothetical protein
MEISHQALSSRAAAEVNTTIFGKGFTLQECSSEPRLVVHEDFGMIEDSDIRDFTAYSQDRNRIVISGCEAKVHPFRLMVVDEEGYDGPLFQIPQEVRGNRHRYPEVFQFVPALIFIPPGIPVSYWRDVQWLDMYPMPSRKLLDASSLIDSLFIRSYSMHQRQNP